MLRLDGPLRGDQPGHDGLPGDHQDAVGALAFDLESGRHGLLMEVHEVLKCGDEVMSPETGVASLFRHGFCSFLQKIRENQRRGDKSY
jgi:hypothetical protein